jgi:hypothetical protein
LRLFFVPTEKERLEDRIRWLSGKLAKSGPDDWQALAKQLQEALHEHTGLVRKLAAEKLAQMPALSKKLS